MTADQREIHEMSEIVTRQTEPKPTPTPVCFVVHSTPGYANSFFFFHVMDSNLARWNITRVIAEQGSAVATMAAFWCKLNGVRLTVIMIDLTVPQIDDRPRRYRQIAEEGPDAALIFNQAPHWLDFAQTLHDAKTKVYFVQSEAQVPHYTHWEPGMTRMPAAPSEREVVRAVRRSRPKQRLTPEERAQRQREAKEQYNDRARMLKALSWPTRTSAIPRGRPKKRLTMTRHG
jgi:hypothetical protein